MRLFPECSLLKLPPARRACWLVLLAIGLTATAHRAGASDDLQFFEARIRPVLVQHCDRCHSADARELQGGLRLDLKAGWVQGGDSGEPAIVPGEPDRSWLLKAVQHADGIVAMPLKEPKLPATVIADLEEWIRRGAPDPREGSVTRRNKSADWEAEYQNRLDWWSLKPLQPTAPPTTQLATWPRNAVDQFLLSRLEQQGLQPVAEADRATLIRRLSLSLTGLPPTPALSARFRDATSPDWYDQLVDTLLDSPHFGERWARHWMDVVHYADTHGYEWDVPAKNAWRYRDYLTRAFNADVPFNRLILEQIAGDLLEPRLDPLTRQNESLLGPLALRLGERRHGDSAAADGVSQEAVANMIDTLGKGFLATTLACAQCHDHKLDAVEQRDYYSLAGMLMSTRFSTRLLDTVDPNVTVIERLRGLKVQIKEELSRLWLAAITPEGLAATLRTIPADATPSTAFPATLVEYWKRSLANPVTAEEFTAERQRRRESNRTHLTVVADFTTEQPTGEWKLEGFGPRHGYARDGELIVADDGDLAIQQIVPAGRYTHLWSPRLAGSLQSPQLDPLQPVTLSLQLAGGKASSFTFVLDRALNSERLQFLNRPTPSWLTVTAGRFDTLEGSLDTFPRRVYFEVTTKAYNNYFPPRVGYGGASEAEVSDPRSWFGITRVVQHPAGQPPLDELERFEPLFEPAADTDWALRLARLFRTAVERWSRGETGPDDVLLLNEGLAQKLLPHAVTTSPELNRLVTEYRSLEKQLEPDCTAGSVDEWGEGRDDRIGLRGSYTDLGDPVPRGGLRLLGSIRPRENPSSSGRLEWARQIADDNNPLTARVYVNRIWKHLFGEGLVRTVDDFGHLGERPSHPELLDTLAAQFIADGWSTKRLIRRLVTTSTWRQASVPHPQALAVDPENRLWHHHPLRRLEAEAIRDSMLAVSGRLDPRLYGPPIEPYRTAVDPQKRLLQGPLDGEGRRSLYTEMTLMEPPRFLALFNQPLPRQTVGRRDVTNVPDQALALLNDPFVQEMARLWSQRVLQDGSTQPADRLASMLHLALSRPPRPGEVTLLTQLVEQSAELRGARDTLLTTPEVWQDAAHAIFNLKEFLYVP